MPCPRPALNLDASDSSSQRALQQAGPLRYGVGYTIGATGKPVYIAAAASLRCIWIYSRILTLASPPTARAKPRSGQKSNPPTKKGRAGSGRFGPGWNQADSLGLDPVGGTKKPENRALRGAGDLEDGPLTCPSDPMWAGSGRPWALPPTPPQARPFTPRIRWGSEAVVIGPAGDLLGRTQQ